MHGATAWLVRDRCIHWSMPCGIVAIMESATSRYSSFWNHANALVPSSLTVSTACVCVCVCVCGGGGGVCVCVCVKANSLQLIICAPRSMSWDGSIGLRPV